ncbi:hypothetical protein PGT21_037244 [Puccinia graminis f. sp. tritici]|uniref:Uncharacterized protein n=1 Tax=Puccinia graminis f. sp. tritici TaxID=56615 RepID=A0A5B0R3U8_PUCGR|nr:hypothetical protein PGTUg99_019516 [Puccinia graminis f. sp. tritici]KAA1120187.1 hypothetical protein PGT21_037244 [Puccinia graminis f. sp. tritici]
MDRINCLCERIIEELMIKEASSKKRDNCTRRIGHRRARVIRDVENFLTISRSQCPRTYEAATLRALACHLICLPSSRDVFVEAFADHDTA